MMIFLIIIIKMIKNLEFKKDKKLNYKKNEF